MNMKPFSLEEYLKNPSRKLITRDGRKVTRIVCTDARGHFPIVALVKNDYNSNEVSLSYTNDGKFYKGSSSIEDLFFAPEKYERWINLYKDNNGIYASMDTFKTKEEAEALSCSSCIATVKVEWEE